MANRIITRSVSRRNPPTGSSRYTSFCQATRLAAEMAAEIAAAPVYTVTGPELIARIAACRTHRALASLNAGILIDLINAHPAATVEELVNLRQTH